MLHSLLPNTIVQLLAFIIGRTVPLLKQPHGPHCEVGEDDDAKKFSPPLAMLPNPVLSCLSGESDPTVLEPFDVTLWYSGVPHTPNLLKISSDIESGFRNGFSGILDTDFKFESNFYDHY